VFIEYPMLPAEMYFPFVYLLSSRDKSLLTELNEGKAKQFQLV
jgi:hypothetical protein